MDNDAATRLAYVRDMYAVPRRLGPVRMRRIADLLIAIGLLAIILPLLFLIALLIRCESTGPIFETKSCIGRGGRRFQMLRFRTTRYEQAQGPFGRVRDRQSAHFSAAAASMSCPNCSMSFAVR